MGREFNVQTLIDNVTTSTYDDTSELLVSDIYCWAKLEESEAMAQQKELMKVQNVRGLLRKKIYSAKPIDDPAYNISYELYGYAVLYKTEN